MSDEIIKRKKIKELIGKLSVSKDFYTEVDKEVIRIIQKSIGRAKDNKRTTVMGRDV